MRISYLSGSVVPSTTANSVHVMKMAAAFSRGGHEVTLYAWRGDDAGADPFAHYGVEASYRIRRVRPLPLPGGGTVPFTARVLGDLLAQGRPDLVYARNLSALASIALAGAPMVLEVHNPHRAGREETLFRWLSRRGNFLGAVAISQALRAEYEARHPHLRGRVLVAHDGADPISATDGTAAADVRWPGRPGRLQVGYVGQLYPGKGMEVLVRLAAACPGMDFHVVGGGPADVEHWRGELARAGGTEANTFFHGHVPHGVLPAYYRRCDVFLAPYQPVVSGAGGGRDLSRWMSPLKLFEYMAAGRPVVSSDLPVLREVLEDGINALLVPPTDLDGWRGALTRLEAESGLRERLGATALRHFEARHTWLRRAERILAFVEGARVRRESAGRSATAPGARRRNREGSVDG